MLMKLTASFPLSVSTYLSISFLFYFSLTLTSIFHLYLKNCYSFHTIFLSYFTCIFSVCFFYSFLSLIFFFLLYFFVSLSHSLPPFFHSLPRKCQPPCQLLKKNAFKKLTFLRPNLNETTIAD